MFVGGEGGRACTEEEAQPCPQPVFEFSIPFIFVAGAVLNQLWIIYHHLICLVPLFQGQLQVACRNSTQTGPHIICFHF